jgi:hypothetical protein
MKVHRRRTIIDLDQRRGSDRDRARASVPFFTRSAYVCRGTR